MARNGPGAHPRSAPAVLPFPLARPVAQSPNQTARPATSLPPSPPGLPIRPLERLKWGLALAGLTGPSRRLQHGAGKVLFLARGCGPQARYSTRCRAPRLRENGRQSYRFHITKHPDWSNVIPVAGTPKSRIITDVPKRPTAVHHLALLLLLASAVASSRTPLQVTISASA